MRIFLFIYIAWTHKRFVRFYTSTHTSIKYHSHSFSPSFARPLQCTTMSHTSASVTPLYKASTKVLGCRFMYQNTWKQCPAKSSNIFPYKYFNIVNHCIRVICPSRVDNCGFFLFNSKTVIYTYKVDDAVHEISKQQIIVIVIIHVYTRTSHENHGHLYTWWSEMFYFTTQTTQ